MNMKTIYSLWLMVCVFLLAGCDDASSTMHPDPIPTTDVTLRIALEGTSSRVGETDNQNSSSEGLRTLRIVVFSQVSKTIVYNQKFTTLASTLTLEDIPVGASAIFAFGNEESLGVEYTNEELAKLLVEENNYKVLFTDNAQSYIFPLLATSDHFTKNGLPISGRTDVTIAPNQPTIEMALTRSVVKLNFQIENATTQPINLQKTTFGKFISNQLYLFRQQTLDIPGTVEYREFTFIEQGNGFAIQPGTPSDPLVAYILPSDPPIAGQTENPFWISLETAKGVYGKQTLGDIDYLYRNTQLNILARITSEVNIVINFQVAPWDNYNVDVPSFD